MLNKNPQVTQRALKLEKMLNSLPDLTKSSRLLNIQHKKCKLSIQTFEDDINSIINSKEPVFNRTKNYIDLKSKVILFSFSPTRISRCPNTSTKPKLCFH